jgi:hypothetical protein
MAFRTTMKKIKPLKKKACSVCTSPMKLAPAKFKPYPKKK